MTALRPWICILLLAGLPGVRSGAEPVAADRIAQLADDERPAWEAYWDRSQKARAADETRIQDELRQLGVGAKWRPAPTNRRMPARLRKPERDWCGSDEARRVVDCILSFQTPSGGWSKNVGIWAAPREPGMGFGESRAHYRGTFDNNATTTPLRILGRIGMAEGQPKAREGFLEGLRYVLDARFPNGGWPQVYPLEGGYHDNVTFNDGAMINVLEFLHEVAGGTYPFVADAERAEAREAIVRGVDFILRSQVVQDGKPTVWCAQHDPLTLRPAMARSFEWASLSGGESAGVVLYLMEHGPRTDEVRRAVEAAHAWFRRNAIYGKRFHMRRLELVDEEGAGPIWARFHELETGRPMFVERNADHAVYSLEDLPPESNGYAWYGDAGSEVLARFPAWKERLRDGNGH